MALVLKQLRRCNGSCCKQSPRFPNRAGDDCIYHTGGDGKETSGCELMAGTKTILDDGTKSIVSPTRDAYQVYIDTCIDWPQKNSTPRKDDTGNCCWQWVDE